MSLRHWLKKHFSYNTQEIFNKIAWDNFEGCEKILDIACGKGSFLAHNPSRAQGIDNNQKSVDYCRKQGYSVELADALDLPFESESFMGVHCAHLIEHFYPEEAWQLLKEINRILKPGGIVCLRAPLLTRHFYNDLSHIRPYPPHAVMEYLKEENHLEQPKTFEEISGSYEQKLLLWRHLPIGAGMFKGFLIQRFFEALARVGIRSFQRSGYILVAKKVDRE